MGRRPSLFSQKNLKAMSKHPVRFFVALLCNCIVWIGVGIFFAVEFYASIAIYPFIIALISLIVGIGIICSYINQKKQYLEEQEMLTQSNMNEIDQMTGRTFEKFLQAIYIKLGYEATLTRTTGDYGADIILTKDNIITAIQVKHSKNKIGISAVQEVIGAKKYYNASRIAVVTNNYFTQPACNLAVSNNVELIDRTELAYLICQSKQNEQNNIEEIEKNVA